MNTRLDASDQDLLLRALLREGRRLAMDGPVVLSLCCRSAPQQFAHRKQQRDSQQIASV
jgi:hypothetical protein